ASLASSVRRGGVVSGKMRRGAGLIPADWKYSCSSESVQRLSRLGSAAPVNPAASAVTRPAAAAGSEVPAELVAKTLAELRTGWERVPRMESTCAAGENDTAEAWAGPVIGARSRKTSLSLAGY